MKKTTFIAFLFLVINAYPQQEPLFSQHYLNDMTINPAISGSQPYNSLTIQTRQQWLGFEGAPLSSKVSYHGSLNNRSAMGGYLMLDKAVPSMQINAHLNYSYHIPLDYDKVNLSFGLGTKIMYHNLDFNISDLPPGYDVAFSASSHDKILADASSGVYLYAETFSFGFSVSNLFQSSFNTAVPGSPYGNIGYRNYYGTGSYRFGVFNADWKLEPSFLIRKMHFQSSLVDLSSRILYLENNWAGLTYRTDGSAVFAFGFGSNNIDISYSYDHTFAGEIMQYNSGTHELTILFRINKFDLKRGVGLSY